METTYPRSAERQTAPAINTVTASSPLRWLARGWQDLIAAPVINLTYGAVIAALLAAVVVGARNVPVLTLTFVSGFLLVAPFLAVGLYDVSRRRERGEKPDIAEALRCCRANGWSIAFIGIVMGLSLLAWGRLTGVLAALSYPMLGPEGHLVTWESLLSADGVWFMALFIMMGAGLAAFVFSIAVVSIPLLLDRPLDGLTAAAVSVSAVLRNGPVMLLWAGMIVALTIVGMSLAFVGLAVTLPLLAHASWHAYRELVADGGETT